MIVYDPNHQTRLSSWFDGMGEWGFTGMGARKTPLFLF